ncbi:MAG: CHAP domain-containing protein [Pseudonocardiaceae bacterium]
MLVAVGAASPAQASGYTVSTPDGSGVQLLTGPSTSAVMEGNRLNEGAGLSIICQAWSAEAVGPRANHIFDKISFPPLDMAHMPWVPDASVAGTAPANQFTAGISTCDPQSTAIAWARSHLGTDKDSGYCQRFVRSAYLAAGVDIGLGDAAAYAEAHRDKLNTTGTPPVGALVYWWGTPDNPYGHVVLSLGDGTAVSTSERSNNTVHILNIDDRSASRPYAGWLTV